jgi:hypothetical protein
MIGNLVSSGQAGADRAALDAALELRQAGAIAEPDGESMSGRGPGGVAVDRWRGGDGGGGHDWKLLGAASIMHRGGERFKLGRCDGAIGAAGRWSD